MLMNGIMVKVIPAYSEFTGLIDKVLRFSVLATALLSVCIQLFLAKH